ncbi:MAG: YMGG-like glycine zipper-containing protein [bacterium]
MRTLGIMSLAGLALASACSRGVDARPDDALKNDLALAAQAQPYQAQQFVSPSEQQYGAPGSAQQYHAVARQPVSRAPAPVYRAPARRTSSRSSSGAGTYYPSAPAEPVRNTKRDAAIGAGAGAIIGAVTSRDKVKGGLIGAAAGGILGGIIGHTVDVHP